MSQGHRYEDYHSAAAKKSAVEAVPRPAVDAWRYCWEPRVLNRKGTSIQ